MSKRRASAVRAHGTTADPASGHRALCQSRAQAPTGKGPPFFSTQWSIVYVPKQGTLHFRTRTTPKIKTVKLSSFALACPATRKVLDIDADLTGDATGQFADYTSAANRQVLPASRRCWV